MTAPDLLARCEDCDDPTAVCEHRGYPRCADCAMGCRECRDDAADRAAEQWADVAREGLA